MILEILAVIGIIILLWVSYYAFAEQPIIHIVKLNEGITMEDDIDKKFSWKFKVEMKKPEIKHYLNFHCKSRYVSYAWESIARCQF